MEQLTVRVVYGLTMETGKRLRAEIEQAAREAEIEILPICRYRKEGIFQYTVEQQAQATFILEEGLQAASPYIEDDIIKLTETGNPQIIYLLNQKHYGTSYMKTLYLCGILNAVFINDATGEKLVRLLLSGRTNEEARAYYGIQLHRDEQKKQEYVNSEYLDSCLGYIEDSALQTEIETKFQFAVSKLSPKENKILIDSLSPQITQFLDKNEIYRHYRSDSNWKVFITRLGSISRKKALISILSSENVKAGELLANSGMIESDIPEAPSKFLPDDAEEDMAVTLERFRNYRQNDRTEESQSTIDPLMEFGDYLRALDA